MEVDIHRRQSFAKFLESGEDVVVKSAIDIVFRYSELRSAIEDFLGSPAFEGVGRVFLLPVPLTVKKSPADGH